MALTTSLPPWTRLTTPGGRSQCSSSSNIFCCDNGTCSDGLSTNVLPQTTAKGRNHSGTIAGKLNGEMAATTPSGWRITVQSMLLAMFSSPYPISIDGAPQATSTHSMPRRTLPRDSSSVLPCSVVTIRAISSKCSSSSCLNLNIVRARTAGGVSLQAGNAAVAAFTAASTSAAVESGVRAMTVPLAGLVTFSASVPDDGVQRPPMKLERSSGCGISAAYTGEEIGPGLFFSFPGKRVPVLFPPI